MCRNCYKKAPKELVILLIPFIKFVYGTFFINTETLKYLPNSPNGLHFPTDSDLRGAVIALARLQETYLLNTTRLANGDIDGVKFK